MRSGLRTPSHLWPPFVLGLFCLFGLVWQSLTAPGYVERHPLFGGSLSFVVCCGLSAVMTVLYLARGRHFRATYGSTAAAVAFRPALYTMAFVLGVLLLNWLAGRFPALERLCIELGRVL